MYRKLKNKIKKRTYTPLTSEDLRGYRNILKLLYHNKAETPLKDTETSKYFIQVPPIHLDMIIDEDRAEIINTRQIYPLNLDKRVYERAILKIKQEVSRQRRELEDKIRDKKQTILHKLYNQIK